MFLATDSSVDLDLRHAESHASLTESQARSIEAELGKGWIVDHHVSYDESLALMISSADPAKQDIVLYVCAEPIGFSVSIMQDDQFRRVGCWGSMSSLHAAIRTIATQRLSLRARFQTGSEGQALGGGAV